MQTTQTRFSACMHCRGAGITFSDSVPIPKFLNPAPVLGPAILQIWESDSCSDSGYNHWSNQNVPIFYLRNDHTDSCYCWNRKLTPDPFFHKFFTPVSSEISDLCEISDLLLFLSYFACQNKEIKSGNYRSFFYVCCAN